jgi:hypothetical protein
MRPPRQTRSLLWLLAGFVAMAARPAHAQRTHVLHVTVVDAARAPVAGTELSATRTSAAPVASAVTDANGAAVLRIAGDDDIQLVARRVGFQRGERFVRLDHDSLDVVIHLRSSTQELPAVQVQADASLNHKRYHVTSDDIAASKRPILSGFDVVTKLRPDMMNPPSSDIYGRCGLHYLWINGQRVVFPPIDPAAATKARMLRHAAQAVTANGAPPPRFGGLIDVPVSVQSALEKIRPEHIDEMNYVDCRDNTSTEMARGQNALFVTLKPGVAYDPVRGSYVSNEASFDAPEATATLPLYRYRVLGVFDLETGDPVAGVDVVDLATGTMAKTSPTGTVSLLFLPVGASTVELRRAGYATQKVDLTISPRDTVPLTLVLNRAP